MAPKTAGVCFSCGTSLENITYKYSRHGYATPTNPLDYLCKTGACGFFHGLTTYLRNRQVETSWQKLRCLSMQTTNENNGNSQSLLETFIPVDTALAEGIRLVAIGKYGAKPLSKSLAIRIMEELEQVEEQMRVWNESWKENWLYQHKVLQRAAFLGSLYMRANWTEEEQEILKKYELGIAPPNRPCSEASLLLAVHPNSFQRLEELHLTETVLKLLQAKYLDALEAEQLAEFILECKTLTDACLSAMVLHILRVRHETSTELLGFANACRKTIESNNALVQTRRSVPVLQITEPFDGVVKSPMTTPLVAKHISEKYGIWTVLIGSDTSGPKYGMNVKSLVERLGEERIPKVTSRRQLEEIFEKQPCPSVLYMDLENLCPALSNLTYLRRTIIKRPCLATVEKVINYIDADALLTSAFHPNYIDKMIQCGASQHFSHVFVVSGGIEGGLAFPVGRRSGITLTSWSQDESQNEVLNSQKVTPSDILSDEIRSQVQYENSPSWLACNAELISRCWDRPGSGNEAFDTVVNATREALDYSLQSKLLQISSHRIVSKPG